MKDKLKKLEELLQNHDWYFERSDDFRWYQAGRDEAEEIHKIIRNLEDVNKGVELYNKHTPFEWKMKREDIKNN